MKDDKSFYTPTMARIYASQGYYEKAADIYRYLLSKNPDQDELKDELSDVEQKLAESPRNNKEDLVRLFRQWFKLINLYNQHYKLKDYDLKTKVNE